MSITLNGTTGILADSPATVKANAFLDAAGGNTATINGAVPASLASPALTGTPTAPTATVGTNTTQIATTAFVLANAASALVFISSATISNVATVDFTGFDASKYSDYVFSLNNVIPVTDGVTLQFKMSVDGGSTFLTSYGSCIQYTGSTVNATNTASAGTHIPITDGNSVGSDVNEFGVSGEVRVFGPDLVARTYMTGFVRATNTAGTNQIGISVGQNEVTTAVNAVRFLFSSGNLESGRITMYGVRKS
jgi:hypothetical protein